MPSTDRRRVLKLMAEIHAILREEMAGHGDNKFARGLSNEGFAGGYQAALHDVEAALTHGHPSDHRGYWSRAEQRLEKNLR